MEVHPSPGPVITGFSCVLDSISDGDVISQLSRY